VFSKFQQQVNLSRRQRYAILFVVNAAKRNLAARAKKIIQNLRRAYPDAHCALDHRNPLQLLVATILSAQCTDVRVNMVTPALFAKYRTAADFAAAPAGELENLIRSTGFFRNKARSIRNCCRTLVDLHDGKVPDTLPALVSLDGIGRKTANVVLGVAYGKAEGIVVDTHVARLSRRMGLTRQRTPEKIEQALIQIVPRADWIDFSHLLIWHGRKRCNARRPDCIQCEVAGVCPKIGVEFTGEHDERTQGRR
jgi:endonuclease-3